ncbi:hypothetical protein K8R30_03590 [archaeon]|nr:hypothetical protein [archaeon]
MKRSVVVFLFLIIVLGSIGFYYRGGDNITGSALDPGDSSGVSRSFSGSSVDEDISVVVSVLIDSGFVHEVYVVEENVPSEFSVVDAGGAVQSGNVLRWSDIDDVNGVDSVDLTYVVRTSQEGIYPFDGFYGLDGMDSEELISGPSLIVGEASDDEAPTFNYTRSGPVSYSDSFLTDIDFGWVDNVGVTQSFVENNFSGGFVNFSGSSWSGVLGAGSYSVRGWARDAVGNWGVTPVYVFSILKRDADLSLSLNEVEGDVSIGVGGSVNVEVEALKDFVLYADGIEIEEGLIYCPSSGLFNLTAVVLEDANYTGDNLTRFVNVEGVLEVVVTLNPSGWLEGTTDFSNVNLSNFLGRFVNEFGEILFLENLNVLRSLNLDSKIVVEDKRIFVDSDSLPEFNFSSRLKFFNVNFTSPIVLKDGVLCSSCTVVSYVDGVLVVDVDGFSEYLIVEEGYEPDPEDCVSDYSCGEWDSCLNGVGKRICVDLNGCSDDKVEEVSCGSSEDKEDNRPISNIRYLIIGFSILGLIVLSIWTWVKLKKIRKVEE